MDNTIYLVGQISGNDLESYEWRERISDYFKDKSSIKIIDPCNNPFNQAWKDMNGSAIEQTRAQRSNILAEQTDGKDEHEVLWLTRTHGIDLLVPKDREYVKQSNIIIANMNQYDPAKPLLGSFFELAWAYDSPEKSVIGIFDGDPKSDYSCNHPFVRSVIDVWVVDDKSACILLEHYFTEVTD